MRLLLLRGRAFNKGEKKDFSRKRVETSQKSPIDHVVSLYGFSIFDHGAMECVIYANVLK